MFQLGLLLLFCIIGVSKQQNKIEVSSGVFEVVATSGAFIDKSLFVKYFYEPELRHAFITAPRHFGKSTNLLMLKSFFGKEVDEKGYPKNNSTTFEIFKKLQIFKDEPEFFFQHFAKYPILNIKLDCFDVDTYDGFLESFQTRVKLLYMQHQYLAESKRLSKIDQSNYVSYTKSGSKFSYSKLIESGFVLSDLLKKHYGTPCIVLIDEYDASIVRAIFNRKTDNTTLQAIGKTLTDFSSRLTKDNPNAARSLLTGCNTIGGFSSTSESNHMNQISIFEDVRLHEFYGFSEQDVITLAERFGQSDKVDDVKLRYDGYIAVRNGTKLFCPYSILSYFSGKAEKDPWVSVTNLEYLRDLLQYNKMGANVEKALEAKGLKTKTHTKMTEKILLNWKQAVNESGSDKEFAEGQRQDYEELVFQYMTECGYFAVTKVYPFIENQAHLKEIRVATNEIKISLFKFLFTRNYLEEKLKVKDKEINIYIESLQLLGTKKNSYSRLAASIGELFKAKMPSNKVEFHAMLHALSLLEVNNFEIVYGYMDSKDRDTASIFFARMDGVGVILNTLVDGELSSKEALAEIVTKQYADVFKEKLPEISSTLNSTILIGLKLTNQPKMVSLSYLSNSFNTSAAKTVTYSISGKGDRSKEEHTFF